MMTTDAATSELPVISERTRRRLHIQGFDRVDDATLAETAPWLRFSPGLCMLTMAIGTALALPWLLGALAVTAVAGSLTPRHPFDLVYNGLLRRVTRTGPLPPNGAPRRFACGMAAVGLVGTAGAFIAGADVAAYVLGGALTLTALVVASAHICVPSLIFRACESSIRRSSAGARP